MYYLFNTVKYLFNFKICQKKYRSHKNQIILSHLPNIPIFTKHNLLESSINFKKLDYYKYEKLYDLYRINNIINNLSQDYVESFLKSFNLKLSKYYKLEKKISFDIISKFIKLICPAKKLYPNYFSEGDAHILVKYEINKKPEFYIDCFIDYMNIIHLK